MAGNDDILETVKEKAAQALRESHRGVILRGGAIGDCILTLPLAAFVKESLGLGGIDLVGNTEYTAFFPARTCIDRIRSIESINLHRLFTNKKEFKLASNELTI